MKILIDGFYINKPRGLGRYIRELLCVYNNYKSADAKIYVAIREKDREFFSNNYSNLFYVVLKDAPFPFWEQYVLAREAQKGQYDVLHCPYNTFPVFFKKSINKLVVTIHDLIFFKHWGDSIYQIVGNIYRRLVLLFLRNNIEVITVSSASKKAIMTRWGFNSKVIMESNELIIKQNNTNFKKCNKKYNNIKYIFHIGGININKNTERVIKAFMDADIHGLYLVIAGMPKNNIFSRKYIDERIIYTGWISDCDIMNCYKNAEAIIFPSLCEGFGLPIQEGLSFFKPVLTSNIEPMTEVAGKAALYVNPYSVDSISKGIKEILSEHKRKELSTKCKDEVKKFQGEKICNEYMRVYGCL